MWERQHEFAAGKIYNMCSDLGGFFLKVAQIIGKPDLAPAAWVRRLVTLCDQSPATPYDVIQVVLEKELGQSVDGLFERFEVNPLGSASVAQSLISAKHRIEMCHLACRSSEFIMVDLWEASQDTFQRTLTVLCRIKSSLCDSGRISGESLKVMLVCGSDLLESFSIPGAWIPEQVRTLCRDFGVVCIHREGQDIEKVISNDDILNEYKTNIKVVDELVPNQISSTRVRDCILRGLSVKYLTADEVINYIKQHRLYLDSTV